jgi:hypothetical protein
MSRQTLTALLLASTILFLVLAVATLLPSSAPVISDLGYSTVGPFAPWSTLTLLFLAGLGWVVQRHIKAQPA